MKGLAGRPESTALSSGPDADEGTQVSLSGDTLTEVTGDQTPRADVGRPPTGRGDVWWPDGLMPTSPPSATIDCLIPARNEEGALPKVLDALPETWLRNIVVVDNASDDSTPSVARDGGADVVYEGQTGYGAACLAGIAALRDNPPDILCFIDADFSDDPRQLPRLILPIIEGNAQLVIGSRVLGARESGALKPQARFGNWLACLLLDQMHGYRFTDLGPFRAITWSALEQLNMSDEDFGWTVEMQMKAARAGLECVEVPVDYRQRRDGRSEITGTISGTVQAGVKILWTLGKGWLVSSSDT